MDGGARSRRGPGWGEWADPGSGFAEQNYVHIIPTVIMHYGIMMFNTVPPHSLSLPDSDSSHGTHDCG